MAILIDPTREIVPAADADQTLIVASGPAAATPGDIERRLASLAPETREKLNWRHTSVDLMKLFASDHTLAVLGNPRAHLNLSGDAAGSPSRHIWLEAEVMRQLAALQVGSPADLVNR